MSTETSINVEDMKAQIARIAELRKTESQVNEMKKEVGRQLEEEEARMLAMLEASGLKNFRSDQGLVSSSFRLSVKVPKSPEDREAFFAYLKSQQLFDNMITVNSQTLNAFYKEQFELARERGDDDFKIPGINEETMTPVLSFKKG